MERTPFAFELKIDKQNQSYNRLRRNLFENLDADNGRGWALVCFF